MCCQTGGVVCGGSHICRCATKPLISDTPAPVNVFCVCVARTLKMWRRRASRADDTTDQLRAVATSDWFTDRDTKKLTNMKTGAELIAEERERQISQEGWNNANDDAYTKFQLVKAAKCYLEPGCDRFLSTAKSPKGDLVPFGWPWDFRYWKPTPEDRTRELVKAGALIAAEIDRLQRQSVNVGGVATANPQPAPTRQTN